MNYIIVIPFSGMFDIEKYARENNVKKYTGAYLPCRGPHYPEKFLIIIEEMDNPELNHSTLGGYYFKDLQELLSYRKILFNDWKNPSVYWKLTNGDYILFGANINEPICIKKTL